MYRPLPVTVLSWLVIVSGTLSFIFLALTTRMPSTLAAIDAMGVPRILYVLPAVIAGGQVVAAFGALYQKEWGRLSLITLMLATPLLGAMQLLFFDLPASWISLVPGIVLAGVTGWVFTRPLAVDWFLGNQVEEPPSVVQLRRYRAGQKSSSELSRLFGIGSLAMSGFLLPMALFGFIIAYTLLGPELGGSSGGFAAVVFGVLLGLPAVLGLGALLIGVFLWGRRRWMATLGWVLVGSGAFWAFGSFVWVDMVSNPELMEAMEAAMAASLPDSPDPPNPFADFAAMRPGFLAMGFVSLAVCVVGTLMVRYRWRVDAYEAAAGEQDSPQLS